MERKQIRSENIVKFNDLFFKIQSGNTSGINIGALYGHDLQGPSNEEQNYGVVVRMTNVKVNGSFRSLPVVSFAYLGSPVIIDENLLEVVGESIFSLINKKQFLLTQEFNLDSPENIYPKRERLTSEFLNDIGQEELVRAYSVSGIIEHLVRSLMALESIEERFKAVEDYFKKPSENPRKETGDRIITAGPGLREQLSNYFVEYGTRNIPEFPSKPKREVYNSGPRRTGSKKEAIDIETQDAMKDHLYNKLNEYFAGSDSENIPEVEVSPEN